VQRSRSNGTLVRLGRLRLGAVVLLLAVAACKPKIGDECVLSTDCSTRGDRLCDTSQPFGYCTQFNCKGNGCPDEATCVLFNSAIPGCGFDDRSGPGGSRSARAWCVFTCQSNADCRAGYVCADPREPPWNALILDNLQSQRTCLVEPDPFAVEAGAGEGGVPAVCSAVAPDGGPGPIDASPARIFDGGAPPPDGGPDAGDAADADGG
jgi:hypothetical protein